MRKKTFIEEGLGWNKVLFNFQWSQTVNGQTTKYKLFDTPLAKQIPGYLPISSSINRQTNSNTFLVISFFDILCSVFC